jgi:hypothetical protein
MKKLNHYTLNLIASVVLALIVIALSLVMFAKTKGLDPEFYSSVTRSENVADTVYSSIEKFFSDNYASSGIPSEVYMDKIDKEEIQELIDLKIEDTISQIKGENVSGSGYDISQVEESITSYFEEFAEENNVEINDSFKEQLENTVSSACSEIEGQSDVFMTEYMDKAGVIQKANKLYSILTPAAAVLAAAAVLIILIMIILSRKNISGAFYWLAVSGFCASVVTAVPCLILKFSNYFSRLVIRTDYVYQAVTGTLKAFVDSILVIQGAIFAVSVVLIILYLITGRTKEK